MNWIINIIISSYDGEAYLRDQLASLFAQSVQDFTVLIRDDGSADNTLAIIAEYQMLYPNRIRLVSGSSENLGSRKSFMKLLEHADAPYIMLCDQDDVWGSDKIEVSLTKIREMEKNHGADKPLLVFTDMRVVDGELNVIHESFWKYQKLDPEIAHDWKKLLAQNVITGCTMIMNRAAREVSLPFAVPTMMHDHWIGVNVAKYGKVGYLDAPTVLYRQHGANVEGAHRYGWSYVLQKLKNIDESIRKLYRSAVHFDVSFVLLLIYKFTINIERILKR
ncbi:MAG: glycosyltransferase family 2 protein [Sulfuricurvum sp.]|nr:glycosyltransferase family 2 protein [Sulfuricurvum sp.]